MTDSLVHSSAQMGTVVTIEIVGHDGSRAELADREDALQRALYWFGAVTETCSRFEPTSELVKLSTQVGEPVKVSALLFEALQFALLVARESGGAYDPTVGARMEARGFDREFRTGRVSRAGAGAQHAATYRDVSIDEAARTVTLHRPLLLDLGAVAKGLAVDLAARELHPFGDFAIDAGGDVYVGGVHGTGRPWSIGIRHPRRDEALFETVSLSNGAVCTSGDYERISPLPGGGHHILDPRGGDPPHAVASVTVIAPTAIVADALSTAAFVLGPEKGIAFMERHGAEGILLTDTLDRFATAGMRDAFFFDPPAPSENSER